MTSVQTETIPVITSENGHNNDIHKAASPALSAQTGDSGTGKSIGTMTTVPITAFDLDDSRYRMNFDVPTAGKVLVAGELFLCCLMLIVTIILAHRLAPGNFAGGFLGCLLVFAVNMAIVILFFYGIKRQKPTWILPYFVLKISAVSFGLICIIFFIASSQQMASPGGAILFTIILMGLQIPLLLVARQVYRYFYEKNRLYKQSLFIQVDMGEPDADDAISEKSQLLSDTSPRSRTPTVPAAKHGGAWL